MFKKLFSGLAMAAACMGSAQALVVTSADSPLIYNFSGISTDFSRLITGVQNAVGTTDISTNWTIFSDQDGAGTSLFSGHIFGYGFSIERWLNPTFDPTEMADGFSIQVEVLEGSLTVSPPATDLEVFFITRRPGIGKDAFEQEASSGFATPLRRALTNNNIPEPGTLVLLVIGAVAFAAIRQRRA